MLVGLNLGRGKICKSFLSTILASLKLEHYARECEFWNFDKIKKNKIKTKQKNTKLLADFLLK